MTGQMTLWEPRPPVRIPDEADTAKQIALYAHQLTRREMEQVVQSFEARNYEMGAFFLWSKTMAGLKSRLALLGMDFVGEMLDRPDITSNNSSPQALTDRDAVQLAEELGMFSLTEARRLRHVMAMIAHFSEPLPEDEDSDDRRMVPEEAMLCLRICVQTVLGQHKQEGALHFTRFRAQLEEQRFVQTDSQIQSLLASPYFFHRTALRVLLALARTSHGAQLENTLANATLIIPLLWSNLLKPDRWTVGRTYSEFFNEGRETPAKGLRHILLKVKGFDYVPEDLRSRIFVAAAAKLMDVHFAFDNFYNEAVAIRALDSLGSVIPDPALAQCMQAVLCVRLGNRYGTSFAAEPTAKSMLQRLGESGWKFYLDECLPGDQIILGKLGDTVIAERWCGVVRQNNLTDIQLDRKEIRDIVKAGKQGIPKKVAKSAEMLFKRLTTSSAPSPKTSTRSAQKSV